MKNLDYLKKSKTSSSDRDFSTISRMSVPTLKLGSRGKRLSYKIPSLNLDVRTYKYYTNF